MEAALTAVAKAAVAAVTGGVGGYKGLVPEQYSDTFATLEGGSTSSGSGRRRLRRHCRR